MPIRSQHRWLYPIDWPQLSAIIRFDRANGSCEHCRRPHGQWVCYLSDGRWWDQTDGNWRDRAERSVRRAVLNPHEEIRTTRVYLAAAHLDHDPTHNRPKNLAALCQRCHLAHDRADNKRRRWLTMRARQAIGDLFTGIYRL